MKVWVSKYALTRGIYELEGDPSPYESANGFFPENNNRLKRQEYHQSEEEAKNKARVMRDDKIANLKVQISRLQQLKF